MSMLAEQTFRSVHFIQIGMTISNGLLQAKKYRARSTITNFVEIEVKLSFDFGDQTI